MEQSILQFAGKSASAGGAKRAKGGGEKAGSGGGGRFLKIGGGVITFLAGLAVGGVIMWGIRPMEEARAQIVEGVVASVSQDAAAISLSDVPGEQGRGYVIAGARWRQGDLPWTDQRPSCIRPGTSGQSIRLGVVRVEKVSDAPSGPAVIWFECLSGPAARAPGS